MLKLLIPDLLEANGIRPKAYDSVPFHLHAEMNDVAAKRALTNTVPASDSPMSA